MTLLNAVNVYLGASALLVVAAVALGCMRATSTQLAQPISYRHQLRFGRAVAAAALLLPFLAVQLGQDTLLPRTAQVWSAPSMQHAAPELLQAEPAITFATDTPVSLTTASRVVTLILLGGIMFFVLRLSIDAWAAWRVVRHAHSIRRHGHLHILVSDNICVPISWWLPGRCFIVVPPALTSRIDDMKTAIRHEGQHHRQFDTRLVYLQQLLRTLFFWNPAAHVLARTLLELQEFACDEAVTALPDVDARDYARCLFDVAEAAHHHRALLLQVSMLGHPAGALLRRRIEAVLQRPVRHLSPSAVAVTCVASTMLMALSACAFNTSVQDRRITPAAAERMAAVARTTSNIPIDMNDQVLDQLNLLLATPDGRAFLKTALQRMPEYEQLITAQLRRRALPDELRAVPLVESGYRNLPSDGQHGAGIWMFIAPTARNYGLTVQSEKDERLDVFAETRAAVDYLADLHSRFGDWRLALLAYNAGSTKVEQGIAATGSRDAWDLVAKGHHSKAFYGDAQYLARVVAVILIMENPSVLTDL